VVLCKNEYVTHVNLLKIFGPIFSILDTLNEL